MRFRLSNNTFGEQDYDIQGYFTIEPQTYPYTDLDGNTQYATDFYVILDTLEDLVKFIDLNGTIYITKPLTYSTITDEPSTANTIGYGNFYIE